MVIRFLKKIIMKNFYNLHTHSKFCDGTGDPEDYVKEALAKEFNTLGFSSHAPVPFKNSFAIKDDQELLEYCKTIRDLQVKYKDQVSILLGLEIDYIEGITREFNDFRQRYGLDYTIGSVHLVKNGNDDRLWFIDGPRVESYDDGLKNIFGGDIRSAVTTYYRQLNQMVTDQKPDIIGHLDKIKMHNKDRYFREDETWYQSLVMDLLDTIKETGSVIEVNTRGIYKKRCNELYPGQWILKEIKEKGLPLTLSADAHKPEEIDGYYPEALKILREIGFKSLVCYGESGWKENAI
jgi:histidinol-phosphatase (PHP family)